MNTPVQALVIRCSSNVGQQLFASLESKLGACADFIGRDAVTAELRSPSAVARAFQASPDLTALIGNGSVELAIDVRATFEPVMPSAIALQGAGATLWAGLQGLSGFRTQAFPSLPGAWVDALGRAARGERVA